MKTVPQDLIDYLMTMIRPPIDNAEIPVILDCTGVDFSTYADESLHGLIVRGRLTPEQSQQINRACKPGAHVLAMTAEDDWVGDESACSLEDSGMEIRDAIQVLEPGVDFWYAAKEATKNRNAGCEHLGQARMLVLKASCLKAGGDSDENASEALSEEGTLPDKSVSTEQTVDSVFDLLAEVIQNNLPDIEQLLTEAGVPQDLVASIMEGNPVLESTIPEDLRQYFGTAEGGSQRGNHHPTLKAIDLCEKILNTLPNTVETVLDPFAGSGSMGIGCIKSGHNYIGIEMDPAYVEIADARLKHWTQKHKGWQGRVVESEFKGPEPKEEQPVSLEDFFNI